MNAERLKVQFKKAISKKPTTIELKRNEFVSNGMHGGSNKEIIVATTDVFIDDFKHSLASNTNEAGEIKRIRSITMVAVADGFKIKKDDFFIIDDKKYVVTYHGEVVPDVYNSDLEVIYLERRT